MKKLMISVLALGLAVPVALLAGAGYGHGPSGFMKRFDLNNDGKVTQEEIDKAKTDLFAKYDTDGNGVLSLEEWQAMRQDRMKERMAEHFKRQDSNGDGGISQEEFMARAQHMMERMDHNGDHAIEADEMGHFGGGFGHHGRHQGENCAKS